MRGEPNATILIAATHIDRAHINQRTAASRFIRKETFIFSWIFRQRWLRENWLVMSVGRKSIIEKKLPGRVYLLKEKGVDSYEGLAALTDKLSSRFQELSGRNSFA